MIYVKNRGVILLFLVTFFTSLLFIVACSDSKTSPEPDPPYFFYETVHTPGISPSETVIEGELPEIEIPDIDSMVPPSPPPDGKVTHEQALARYREYVQNHLVRLDSNSDDPTKRVAPQTIKLTFPVYSTELDDKIPHEIKPYVGVRGYGIDWTGYWYDRGRYGPSKSPLSARSMMIQVLIDVWAFYDFDNDKDIYIITQEVSIPNQNMFTSSNIPYWEYYGYYPEPVQSLGSPYVYLANYFMDALRTTAYISKSSGMSSRLSMNDVTLTQTSPQNANNVDTYSTSIGGTVGGRLGYQGGGVIYLEGNATWSQQHSYTVSDIKVINDGFYGNYPAVRWTMTNNKASNWPPVDTANHLAVFGASWEWIVDNPSPNDVFYINYLIEGWSWTWYLGGHDGFYTQLKSMGWRSPEVPSNSDYRLVKLEPPTRILPPR